LDAVNTILQNIGEAPVNTLSGNLPVDASVALTTLKEISRQIQAQGWHWNTEYRIMTPDSSAEIVFGTDIVSADTYGTSQDIDVILRGRKLFDRRENKNTTAFTDNIKVVVIKLLSFEDLPESARTFITIRASRVYQERNLGAPAISSFNAKDEAFAYGNLRRDEINSADHNMLTDSHSVNSIVNRHYFAGGYN
jgi:hypothetical protein